MRQNEFVPQRFGVGDEAAGVCSRVLGDITVKCLTESRFVDLDVVRRYSGARGIARENDPVRLSVFASLRRETIASLFGKIARDFSVTAFRHVRPENARNEGSPRSRRLLNLFTIPTIVATYAAGIV